jgi:hypothetical protein
MMFFGSETKLFLSVVIHCFLLGPWIAAGISIVGFQFDIRDRTLCLTCLFYFDY